MVNNNKKHWKPFGCPVSVLDESLQTGTPFSKWKQRARVGIYLGQSPIHNRNVALVLNRNTGHVSPQFHVKFDSSFQTVRQDQLECTWQQSTFFVITPLKHTNKRIQETGRSMCKSLWNHRDKYLSRWTLWHSKWPRRLVRRLGQQRGP